LVLKLICNFKEVLETVDMDASFYYGPSIVVNTVSFLEIVVYLIHHMFVSILNILMCSKIFKLFKKIEIIEKNVRTFK
jgi:hypothetical protein